MSEEQLQIGDDIIHGEECYAIYHDGQRSLVYGDTSRSVDHGDGEYGMRNGATEGVPVTLEGGIEHEVGKEKKVM